MKVSLVVAWYDLWVGVYWDRSARALYVLPVPCLGVKIQFAGCVKYVLETEYADGSKATVYSAEVAPELAILFSPRDNPANFDVHTLAAALLFNVRPEDVTTEQRAQAKLANFQQMYGGKPKC